MNVPFWKQVQTAIKQGNVDEVARLIGNDPSDLNMSTPFGSWLHIAASENQLPVIKRLVEMGMDVNVIGGVAKATPLHDAALEGHHEALQLLIANGAQIDTSAPEKNPLFAAIGDGHTQVAQSLLEAGIDPHITYLGTSGRLKNALSYAVESGNREIAELLRAAGCRLPDDTAAKSLGNEVHQTIIDRMSQQFGEVDSQSLHEIIPVDEQLRISIQVIRPNKKNRFVTLFTTGMSDKPMTLPRGQKEYQYAELLMHLPADWPIPSKSDTSDEAWWPIQWLRQIAYYPHQANTWLGGAHTIISNDEPPEPFAANTGFSCMLLMADFAKWSPIEVDARTIHFYTVVPIYTDERDYEKQHGVVDLLQRFEKKGVSAIADSSRVNVALKRS